MFKIKIETKDYDEEFVNELLVNLRKVQMPFIYTEHYLDEIEKRNIPEMQIEHLLLFINPLGIEKFSNHDSRFEIQYPLNADCDVVVIVGVYDPDALILISAIPVMREGSFIDFDDGNVKMICNYDRSIDLMEIHVSDTFKYGQTVIVEEGFYIDFDYYGCPISIELFHLSNRFKLNSRDLANVKIEGNIIITDEFIQIFLKTAKEFGNGGFRVIEKEIENKFGIPPNEFTLLIV